MHHRRHLRHHREHQDDTITLSVGKGDQTMVVARWAIRSVEDVTIENETESLN